jgi:flagellar hook-associated protein 2
LLSLGAISASFETRISDVGQVISAVDSLQAASLALTQPQAFTALTVTSSVPKVLTSTAVGVGPGTFSVQVSQLAQAQTSTSAAQASSFAPIGSGASATVNFQFANGSSQSIALGSGDNTLAGIVSAINRASIGVAASVQTAAAGARLRLTGQTGAANAFTVSASGNAALADLLGSAPGGGLALSASAQNAEGLVNGIAFSGGTNTVNTAVPGLSLNLLATGNATLTVAPQTTQIEGVQSFVKTFNQLQSSLQQFGQGNPVLGQSLSFLQSALGNALGQQRSGLAGIGIIRNQDGTLSLDGATFQSALKASPATVAQVFSNRGQGVADRVLAQTEGSFSPQSLLQLTASGLSAAALFDQALLGLSGQFALFDSFLGSSNQSSLQSSPATLASLASQFSLVQLL